MRGKEDWGISPDERERELAERERIDREQEDQRRAEIRARKEAEEKELLAPLQGRLPTDADIHEQANLFVYMQLRKMNTKGVGAGRNESRAISLAKDLLKMKLAKADPKQAQEAEAVAAEEEANELLMRFEEFKRGNGDQSAQAS